MKTNIIVRFTVEGFHQWKNAPFNRDYLRNKHRHLFYIEVKVSVLHDDREIEFHDLLDFCKVTFGEGDFGGHSCETLAKALINDLIAKYPGREIAVSVFEDGEVGAEVSYVPD